MKYLLLVCVAVIGCNSTESVDPVDPNYEEVCFDMITTDEPSICEEVCWHMLTACQVDPNGYTDANKGYAKCVEMCDARTDLIGFAPVEKQRECILNAENAQECEDCNYWGE